MKLKNRYKPKINPNQGLWCTTVSNCLTLVANLIRKIFVLFFNYLLMVVLKSDTKKFYFNLKPF